MTTLDRIRGGWRPTLLDKARTCETLEEIEGFIDQLRKSPEHVSGEVWAELARMKVEFQR